MAMTPRRVDAERHLARSILYVTALLGDRPRQVDGYIHYFGETPRCASDAGAWSSRVGGRAPARGTCGGAASTGIRRERGGGP
jgi:hypothetical protein